MWLLVALSIYKIYKTRTTWNASNKIPHTMDCRNIFLSLTKNSRGNKCRFWQIVVEALEEFPNHFIQSQTSASTHEYSQGVQKQSLLRHVA